MSQAEIEQIELSIEQAREIVSDGKAAERLAQNPDFKKLVLEGYFVNEAARLVHLSSDPTISEDIRNLVQRDMQGIGGFKRYLSTIVQLGHRAEAEIDEAQYELDELRGEEG